MTDFTMQGLDPATIRMATAPGAPIGRSEEAAEDFEAMFLSQMLSHMFSGIECDGLFGGGAGEETMRSMLVVEYGKIMAKTGDVGLSDAVRDQIIKLQEG
ncbi:MAG: rod-binding protein [Pseudomonadota bacterium]|nr:rod-binding protein [Pseudomonadota bacterium]